MNWYKRSQSTRGWNKEELQVIKELLEEGHSYVQIAKLFDVSYQTIVKLNEKHQFTDIEKQRRDRQKKRDEKDKFIADLYLSPPRGKGWNANKIQKQYGIKHETIMNALKRLGLYEEFHRDMSKAQRKRLEDNPELAKEYSRIMKQRHKDNPELAKEHSRIMKQRYKDNPELAKEFGERMKQFYRDNPENRAEQSRKMLEWWKQFESEDRGKMENRLLSFPTRDQAINSLKGFTWRIRNNPVLSHGVYRKYMEIINNHTYPEDVQQQVV